MTPSPVDQSCACACGRSTFRVGGPPVSRFYCHCNICQSVYRQPFADVTAFWAGAVSLPGNHGIWFQRYRLPPALRRGTCPSCNAPVIGFLRLAPFLQLAFVPSRNFADPSALPPAGAHIFYHRRVDDVNDSLPKISGYWPSELAVTRAVMGSMLHGAGGA